MIFALIIVYVTRNNYSFLLCSLSWSILSIKKKFVLKKPQICQNDCLEEKDKLSRKESTNLIYLKNICVELPGMSLLHKAKINSKQLHTYFPIDSSVRSSHWGVFFRGEEDFLALKMKFQLSGFL